MTQRKTERCTRALAIVQHRLAIWESILAGTPLDAAWGDGYSVDLSVIPAKVQQAKAEEATLRSKLRL